MSIVYLNGQFLPQETATISVMDRGFLFGDSVYEVIPVFQGKLFCAKPHLQRLANSLHEIGLPEKYSEAEWVDILMQLLQRNHAQDKDQIIYLQVTRGHYAARQHAIPKQVNPNIFAFCYDYFPKSTAELSAGFAAITLPDVRHEKCHIKSNCLLPSVLAYQMAENQQAFEAILIRNGFLTEATVSNVFIVKNGEILTPPLSQHILPGITRNLILLLAQEYGIPYREIPIPESALYDADEIWVTGSTKEICPIVSLNQKSVGFGKAGSVWAKIIQYYQDYKKASILEQENLLKD